jgi:acetylornithine deacetylase
MDEPRSHLEEDVVERVRAGRDELVGLVAELVACDTTARSPKDPPRDEVKLQGILAARLEALGADVDVWEPKPTGSGNRFVPDDLDFTGRPQLVARLTGAGDGHSLLLNGHIDAVTPGPLDSWASDPFRAEVRDGFLYGRGANDMKGPIAGLVLAVELLHRLGIRLAGDLLVATVTDEESSGAGGREVVRRGYRADAGLCGEPTEFEAWVACRGILKPRITIEGRAGHSQEPQPPWREGGAVNAIEKLVPILTEIGRLNADWKTRPDMRHPFLAAGDIVPVLVDGGTWDVTYPAFCHLTLDAHYLPVHGLDGGPVKEELRARIDAAAEADDWIAAHPLKWEWEYDVPPAEIPGDHPLVRLALETAAELGRPGHLGGLNSWHDAATFTLFGGTPTFSFGPRGMNTAHAVNECVSVDELVDFAAIIAVTAIRWCGVAT